MMAGCMESMGKSRCGRSPDRATRGKWATVALSHSQRQQGQILMWPVSGPSHSQRQQGQILMWPVSGPSHSQRRQALETSRVRSLLAHVVAHRLASHTPA